MNLLLTFIQEKKWQKKENKSAKKLWKKVKREYCTIKFMLKNLKKLHGTGWMFI